MPAEQRHYTHTDRGFHAVYREGERNHCPGCGRMHWIIGRATAECAFCSTAIALCDGANRQADTRPIIQKRGRDGRWIDRSTR